MAVNLEKLHLQAFIASQVKKAKVDDKLIDLIKRDSKPSRGRQSRNKEHD